MNRLKNSNLFNEIQGKKKQKSKKPLQIGTQAIQNVASIYFLYLITQL